MTVLVGIFVGVRDGVLLGISVEVDLGWRVLVGRPGVTVMKTLGVLDAVKVTEAVTVLVGMSVGEGVSVPTYSEITSTVRAAIVLILEKAESTMSWGSMSALLGVRGSVKATAETTQNRLKPRIPIVRTVKGPEYSLIFTLASLLICQIPVRISFDDATILLNHNLSN